jgi:hypothetical protein
MRVIPSSCGPNLLAAISILAALLVGARPSFATPCLTTAEIDSKISLKPQPLNGSALAQFNALQAQAVLAIRNYKPPLATKGAPTPSPAVVVDYLVSQAKLELEAYVLSDVVSRLCNKPEAQPYFPNTCASSFSKTTQSAVQITSNFEQLRVGFRLDVESLPACLIFQRSGANSLLGYFLKTTVDQLVSDSNHDYAALIHALAINPGVEHECDDYPNTQSAGCHIYFAVVALDSALYVRTRYEPGFNFSDQLNSGPGRAEQIALDFSGAFLADLSIARCPQTALGTTPDICAEAKPDKTDYHTDATTPLAWWTEKLGLLFHTIPATPGPGTTSLTAAVAEFLKFADYATTIESIISSIAKTTAQIAATPAGSTASVQTLQGQLQALRFQLAGAIGEFVSSGLEQFARLSVPTVLDNVRVNNADKLQTLQIAQLVRATSDAIYAYRDFQDGDYVDGVSQLVQSLSEVKCSDRDAVAARPTNPCGFLLTNTASGFPIEIIGTIAQLASAKDGASFATAAQNASGGPDAWRQKDSQSLFWLGSFVGGQGGREHLKAPGYSESRTDYGLFVPLGFGYSWPNVLLGRPVNLYASVVDLGSLVSTSSGSSATNTTVNSGAKTGWSQLLAPGIYTSIRVLGPVYFGAGYAFKTPGLRAVTLANGQTVNADSSRLELFLGVDVTLFGLHF